MPEDEEKFTAVTYNYYEQLNGYEYLKSLGIGYHFYQGRYLTAIADVLDTDLGRRIVALMEFLSWLWFHAARCLRMSPSDK